MKSQIPEKVRERVEEIETVLRKKHQVERVKLDSVEINLLNRVKYIYSYLVRAKRRDAKNFFLDISVSVVFGSRGGIRSARIMRPLSKDRTARGWKKFERWLRIIAI